MDAGSWLSLCSGRPVPEPQGRAAACTGASRLRAQEPPSGSQRPVSAAPAAVWLPASPRMCAPGGAPPHCVRTGRPRARSPGTSAPRRRGSAAAGPHRGLCPQPGPGLVPAGVPETPPPRPRTGVRVTCRLLLASRPPRGRTGSTAPGGVRGRVFLGEMPAAAAALDPEERAERVTCWPGALCWRREEAVRAGGGTGRGRCPGQAAFFFHRPNILWSTTPGIQFLDLLFGNLAPP